MHSVSIINGSAFLSPAGNPHVSIDRIIVSMYSLFSNVSSKRNILRDIPLYARIFGHRVLRLVLNRIFQEDI